MIPFEELSRYLPQYLSAESKKELFQDLKDFPTNISDRKFYTSKPLDPALVYQGDGIKDMMIINLPDQDIRPHTAMILSNTCDMDLNNQRFLENRVVYAPIVRLSNYRKMLLVHHKIDVNQINNHIDDLTKQYISHFFFLPAGLGLPYDGFVMLDRLNNCKRAHIDQEFLDKNRLFILSNYGFYILLLKISIHFTRIREKIDRASENDE